MKPLPFSYALRNLLRVPTRLLQMVAGTAIVVLLVLGAAAFTQGIQGVLVASGSPRNAIILGAGSEESVERSEISAAVPGIVRASVRGIETRLGVAAVSGQVHYNGVIHTDGAATDGRQALLRGVDHAALRVHPSVALVEGRFPGPGEVMVGRLAARQLGLPAAALATGATIEFENRRFTVVGRFEAPGTVMESEIWFDLVDLMTQTQRDTLSCVVVRMETAKTVARLDLFCKQRLDLELISLRESEYFGKLRGFFSPVTTMVWITALLIATGAVFGGLNTLYAAFASRIRELATLRAIGFSRPALFLSLLQESMVAALVGTLIATALALLVLDGRSVPFSTGILTLRFHSGLLLLGLAAGLGLGAIGTIPPAATCLSRKLTSALRSA